MTINDLLQLVQDGTITNMDTEIVIHTKDKYYQCSWWDLGEYGLDHKEIYEEIKTKKSILILG